MQRVASAVVLLGFLGLGVPACKGEPAGSVSPDLGASEAPSVDAWAVYEGLEAEIAAGEGAESARKRALEQVRLAADDSSAAYAYARAAVAGRLAQTRGLKALKLIAEVRDWALQSIERDPLFEGMAATRLLGSLYVLAGNHLDGADSEDGLDLLESVVEAHPDDPLSHLRLAEGFIALGDPDPGLESLCIAMGGRASLTSEESELLDRLLEDIGGAELLSCEGREAP